MTIIRKDKGKAWRGVCKKALLAFIEDHEREWQVRDGRVFFETESAAKVKVPSKALIAQSLAYANELERIV